MKSKIWFKIFFRILFCVVVGFFIAGSPVFGAEQWKEYKSRHFFIYYQGAPYDFVSAVSKYAEVFYEEIFKNLGVPVDERWSFEERALIYIYDNQQDYVASGKQTGWSHGTAFAREKTIRTFPMASGFFDSTLPHELAHIIFRGYIGLDVTVPTWFEEGVAMYQEQAKRYGAHQVVKQAIASNIFLSLPQLTKYPLTNQATLQQVELYYWEAASFMNFLIREMGEQRFLAFLRDLRRSKSFDGSLMNVYVRFKNTDDLNKAWLNYLKK